MSLLVLRYPAALPCPQRANVAPVDRRALGTPDKPREARAQARDRLARVTVTFPPMSSAQYAVFRAWWRDDLELGGRWFVADWPNMRGAATLVYRFVGAPRWAFVPGGFFSISAELEIRGEGLDPVRMPETLFLAHLDGDAFEEVSESTMSASGSLSYATSATGFDREGVFTSSQALRLLTPNRDFLGRPQWQWEAFLTLDNPTIYQAKTVFYIATYPSANSQGRLLFLVQVSSGGAAVGVSVHDTSQIGFISLTNLSLGSNVISQTARTHVRVIRDGSTVSQWHDGVKVAEFTDYDFSSADVYSDCRIYIGASPGALVSGTESGFAAYYRGRIDEVRFASELTDAGEFTPPTRPFTLESTA